MGGVLFVVAAFALASYAATTGPRLLQEDATGEDACRVVIEQEDLRFDHPQSAAAVSVHCACSAADIQVACDPATWLQALVPPSDLSVLGNGTCLLMPGLVLLPYSTVSFTYQHSPPLPLVPARVSFFNCTPSPSSSSSFCNHTNFLMALALALALALLASRSLALGPFLGIS